MGTTSSTTLYTHAQNESGDTTPAASVDNNFEAVEEKEVVLAAAPHPHPLCPVCLEPPAAEPIAFGPCGHMACASCALGVVRFALERAAEGGVHENLSPALAGHLKGTRGAASAAVRMALCPVACATCEGEGVVAGTYPAGWIGEACVRALPLSENEVARFVRAAAASVVAAAAAADSPSARIRICPGRGCEAVHVVDELHDHDGGLLRACPLCDTELCATCGLSWAAESGERHFGRSCDQWADVLRDKDATAESILGSFAGRKQCSECGFVVERFRGHACHHVRCRCGKEFCYVCMSVWTGSCENRCPFRCDDTCGCATCPECASGAHCEYCSQDGRCPAGEEEEARALREVREDKARAALMETGWCGPRHRTPAPAKGGVGGGGGGVDDAAAAAAAAEVAQSFSRPRNAADLVRVLEWAGKQETPDECTTCEVVRAGASLMEQSTVASLEKVAALDAIALQPPTTSGQQAPPPLPVWLATAAANPDSPHLLQAAAVFLEEAVKTAVDSGWVELDHLARLFGLVRRHIAAESGADDDRLCPQRARAQAVDACVRLIQSALNTPAAARNGGGDDPTLLLLRPSRRSWAAKVVQAGGPAVLDAYFGLIAKRLEACCRSAEGPAAVSSRRALVKAAEEVLATATGSIARALDANSSERFLGEAAMDVFLAGGLVANIQRLLLCCDAFCGDDDTSAAKTDALAFRSAGFSALLGVSNVGARYPNVPARAEAAKNLESIFESFGLSFFVNMNASLGLSLKESETLDGITLRILLKEERPATATSALGDEAEATEAAIDWAVSLAGFARKEVLRLLFSFSPPGFADRDGTRAPDATAAELPPLLALGALADLLADSGRPAGVRREAAAAFLLDEDLAEENGTVFIKDKDGAAPAAVPEGADTLARILARPRYEDGGIRIPCPPRSAAAWEMADKFDVRFGAELLLDLARHTRIHRATGNALRPLLRRLAAGLASVTLGLDESPDLDAGVAAPSLEQLLRLAEAASARGLAPGAMSASSSYEEPIRGVRDGVQDVAVTELHTTGGYTSIALLLLRVVSDDLTTNPLPPLAPDGEEARGVRRALSTVTTDKPVSLSNAGAGLPSSDGGGAHVASPRVAALLPLISRGAALFAAVEEECTRLVLEEGKSYNAADTTVPLRAAFAFVPVLRAAVLAAGGSGAGGGGTSEVGPVLPGALGPALADPIDDEETIVGYMGVQRGSSGSTARICFPEVIAAVHLADGLSHLEQRHGAGREGGGGGARSPLAGLRCVAYGTLRSVFRRYQEGPSTWPAIERFVGAWAPVVLPALLPSVRDDAYAALSEGRMSAVAYAIPFLDAAIAASSTTAASGAAAAAAAPIGQVRSLIVDLATYVAAVLRSRVSVPVPVPTLVRLFGVENTTGDPQTLPQHAFTGEAGEADSETDVVSLGSEPYRGNRFTCIALTAFGKAGGFEALVDRLRAEAALAWQARAESKVSPLPDAAATSAMGWLYCIFSRNGHWTYSVDWAERHYAALCDAAADRIASFGPDQLAKAEEQVRAADLVTAMVNTGHNMIQRYAAPADCDARTDAILNGSLDDPRRRQRGAALLPIDIRSCRGRFARLLVDTALTCLESTSDDRPTRGLDRLSTLCKGSTYSENVLVPSHSSDALFPVELFGALGGADAATRMLQHAACVSANAKAQGWISYLVTLFKDYDGISYRTSCRGALEHIAAFTGAVWALPLSGRSVLASSGVFGASAAAASAALQERHMDLLVDIIGIQVASEGGRTTSDGSYILRNGAIALVLKRVRRPSLIKRFVDRILGDAELVKQLLVSEDWMRFLASISVTIIRSFAADLAAYRDAAERLAGRCPAADELLAAAADPTHPCRVGFFPLLWDVVVRGHPATGRLTWEDLGDEERTALRGFMDPDAYGDRLRTCIEDVGDRLLSSDEVTAALTLPLAAACLRRALAAMRAGTASPWAGKAVGSLLASAERRLVDAGKRKDFFEGLRSLTDDDVKVGVQTQPEEALADAIVVGLEAVLRKHSARLARGSASDGNVGTIDGVPASTFVRDHLMAFVRLARRLSTESTDAGVDEAVAPRPAAASLSSFTTLARLLVTERLLGDIGVAIFVNFARGECARILPPAAAVDVLARLSRDGGLAAAVRGASAENTVLVAGPAEVVLGLVHLASAKSTAANSFIMRSSPSKGTYTLRTHPSELVGLEDAVEALLALEEESDKEALTQLTAFLDVIATSADLPRGMTEDDEACRTQVGSWRWLSRFAARAASASSPTTSISSSTSSTPVCCAVRVCRRVFLLKVLHEVLSRAVAPTAKKVSAPTVAVVETAEEGRGETGEDGTNGNDGSNGDIVERDIVERDLVPAAKQDGDVLVLGLEGGNLPRFAFPGAAAFSQTACVRKSGHSQSAVAESRVRVKIRAGLETVGDLRARFAGHMGLENETRSVLLARTDVYPFVLLDDDDVLLTEPIPDLVAESYPYGVPPAAVGKRARLSALERLRAAEMRAGALKSAGSRTEGNVSSAASPAGGSPTKVASERAGAVSTSSAPAASSDVTSCPPAAVHAGSILGDAIRATVLAPDGFVASVATSSLSRGRTSKEAVLSGGVTGGSEEARTAEEEAVDLALEGIHALLLDVAPSSPEADAVGALRDARAAERAQLQVPLEDEPSTAALAEAVVVGEGEE
jgi:hypothetical protein